MIVGGNIETLCRNVIRLPDLAEEAVRRVGAKVEAIRSVGEAVGGDADLGAACVVDPLLEGEPLQILCKADIAVG